MNPFTLSVSFFATPLGPMAAGGNEKFLFFLDFVENQDSLSPFLERFCRASQAVVTFALASSVTQAQAELHAYFAGKLKKFSTPIRLLGTPFQQQTWDELVRIPYGETRGYAAQALAIGNPKGYRAVANANGANPVSILVPCHRVLASSGKLAGYRGGVERKQWLLQHEKKNSLTF